MYPGPGLDRMEVANHISSATGRMFENVWMELGKHAGDGMLRNDSTLNIKSLGNYARSQGISDWQTADLVSDMTGIGLESAHSEINAQDLAALQARPGMASPPRPFLPSAAGGVASRSHFVHSAVRSFDEALKLLRTVLENGKSGDSGRRRLRRDALRKLGDHGCSQELLQVVRRFVKSGDCDARETRRAALKLLGGTAADGLCSLVIHYAKSGDCDARETRRTALSKLGEFGCTQKLMTIAERFVKSGDCDARETRRSALKMLGPDSANLLEDFVMKYAKSGDCDAREARRTALRKLGTFGNRNALKRIADRLSSSGDSDARETRRMALDLL